MHSELPVVLVVPDLAVTRDHRVQSEPSELRVPPDTEDLSTAIYKDQPVETGQMVQGVTLDLGELLDTLGPFLLVEL